VYLYYGIASLFLCQADSTLSYVNVRGYAMDETDVRKLLGQNVKRFRTERGFSQATLAEKIDTSCNHISDIETGKYWVSSAYLAKLADTLEVEVFEFFKPEEDVSKDVLATINKHLDIISESLKNSVEKSITDSVRKIRKNL
jgi:transcriptional regulator with XRE-family HTH domain